MDRSLHTISVKLSEPWKTIPFIMEKSVFLLHFANVIIFLLRFLCLRLRLWSINPWLIRKIVVVWVKRLLFRPLFLFIMQFLRVCGERGKGDVCWEVTDPWNLPIVWCGYVFMAFDGSDTVDKWAVSSVIDVQDGSSCQFYHLCHHVHS